MDPLATASRLAVGISTLLTYPLVFIGFRDGMVDLLDVPIERQTSRNMDVLTLLLLTLPTVMAVFVTDLGMTVRSNVPTSRQTPIQWCRERGMNQLDTHGD